MPSLPDSRSVTVNPSTESLVTRSLLGWEFENPDVYKQTAIPWCTTHDDIASWDALNERCWAYGRTTTEGACVISTGGPDHKWWMDTE